LPVRIFKASIRKNPFIGAYVTLHSKRALVSPVVTQSFKKNLREVLGVEYIASSTVGLVYSVNVMVAMNSNGIILPKTISEEELEEISKLGIPKLVVQSKLLAWGNLVIANDKGCVISDYVPNEEASKIADFLGVDWIRISVGNYHSIGPFFAVSNELGLASTLVKPETLEKVADVLKIRIVPTTLNGGEVLVKLGALVHDNAILVGKRTSGTELLNISALS
jgi:translation initiation factor 6